MTRIPQVRTLADPSTFLARCAALAIELPFDEVMAAGPASPLVQPLAIGDRTVGNRFTILPMEGWDGTTDGRPTELVERRWRRFGASGAKLIWGGEAVAVRADGRANPNQLVLDERTAPDLAALRESLVTEHAARHTTTDDLLVGLQLTHSGRFARPEGAARPRVAYRHPLLDHRVGADDDAVLTDGELDDLAACFVQAASRAADAGFDFVDVKHCHGYLGHELLSAVDRPGRYGGDLEGRTALLRRVAEGIGSAAPELMIGVRLSAYDFVPFAAGADGRGRPEVQSAYRYAFGGDGTGVGVDLTETHALCTHVADLGIAMICVTAGSPYYNPHIQRPAYFPPSDGYQPPDDPLVDVARLLHATAEIARAHPTLTVVGSGLSYLQEWLPHVAQAAVRDGWMHSAGLGRMALSYPSLAADVLAGRPLDRRAICRTFSDCTTAPRNGLVSGCYPLDDFYKARPERAVLATVKRRARRGS